MYRACVAFLALGLLAVALVGCGRFGFEQRAAWRTEAEEACLSAKLVQPTAYMSRTSEIDGPGVCGITYPFRVSAFAAGSVTLSNRVTLGCPMIPEVNGWIADTVQPAAELYFGMPVSDIRAGTYSCRGRNNQAGAKLSEHAFGNAIDIMSFKLADGRAISVEKGWRGAQDEQDFLREVFLGACRHFTTVLAPGSDMFHYNHLHLDLARHDPRGRRRICKPILKFEPRIDPDRVAASPAPPRARTTIVPLPEADEPLEPLDGGDPFEAADGRAAPGARMPAPVQASLAPPSPAARPLPAAPPLRQSVLAPMPARPASPAAAYPRQAIAPMPRAVSAAPPLVLQPSLSGSGGLY